MCRVPAQLKELIKQRLCAAAEDIFSLFEKTLTEYEEEDERQRALLEQLLRRPSVLHNTDTGPHVQAESSATQSTGVEEMEDFCCNINTPLSCSSIKVEVQLSDTEEVVLKATEDEIWTQPYEQTEDCPGPEHPEPAVPLSSPGGTQLHQDKPLTHSDSDENEHGIEAQHNLCWVCGKSYKWKTGLTKHMKTHTGEKPFSCSDCGKRFVHKTELCSHMFVHKSPITLKIQTAASEPQEGSTKAEQTQGDSCRSCSICGKEFPWTSLLRQHMVSHSNERPFSCSVCEKTFKSKRGLNDHMLLVHKILIIPENPRAANVPQGSSFLVKQSCGEISKACSICGKEFFRNSLLKQHMRCHSKERPFSCSVCGKSCKSKSDLYAHMFVHKNKTIPENKGASKTCSICGKEFRLTNLLHRHMKSHSDERPFSCSVCGKTFKKKTGLYSHMFVHKTRTVPENTSTSSEPQGGSSTMEPTQGKAPIVCVVCGKLFPWRGCLRKHMMTHTGEKPFSCLICGKSFNRNSRLQLHMAIHNRARSSRCSREPRHELDAKRESGQEQTRTKPKPNPLHSESIAEVE